MSYIDDIFENQIPIAVYCGPQPAFERDGVTYPDKIVEEQYQLLKECGVNTIFGHEDLFSTKNEHLAYRAMDICHKLGLAYFARDYVSYEYCSDGKGKRHYSELTEAEKDDLDKRYEQSLHKYKDHPAFAGVMFIDEPGESSFEGIRRGKAVFDRVCPGKKFYVNLFPYNVSAYLYQYGREKGGTLIDPIYQPVVNTHLERYQAYLDRYLSVVNPDFVSYDAYSFVGRVGIDNAIHRALWDMTQYVSDVCRKTGRGYWHFLQCGGRWDNDWNTRITTMADVNLQISVAMAFGTNVLQIFPGCLPVWFYGGINHSGVIDAYGNRTEQYPLFQYAFMQLKKIEKYLVHAQLKGMLVSDAPYFGMLPSKETIEEIESRESDRAMVTFDGNLHQLGGVQLKEYKELKGITSTSQCIVSCFEKNGETFYFLFNNSAYVAADVTLHFDGDYTYEHTQRTVTDTSHGNSLTIHALPAGENVLIRIVGRA